MHRRSVFLILFLALILWFADAGPFRRASRAQPPPVPRTGPSDDGQKKRPVPFAIGRPLWVDDVQYALWVNPLTMDLASEKNLATILDSHVDRFILPCFVAGETLHPVPDGNFPQMAPYGGKEDVLKRIVRGAQARGKSVFVFIDCLEWGGGTGSPEKSVLGRHPEFVEQSRIEPDLPRDRVFVSPAHPEVRRMLRTLVADLGERYPELGGMILRCRLDAGTMLGYSNAARDAYIEARRIDPADLDPTREPADARFRDWLGWRDEQGYTLVQELASVCKSKIEGGKVAVMGRADWRRLGWQERNNLLENWPRWIGAGWIDEVLLESRWDEPYLKEDYAACRPLLASRLNPILATLVVPAAIRDKGSAAVVSLQNQIVTSLALVVEDGEGVKRSKQVKIPATRNQEMAMVGKLSALQRDPRLSVLLTLDLKGPQLQDLFSALKKAAEMEFTTRTPLTTDTVVAGSFSYHQVPALLVMEHLQKSVVRDGAWEQTPEGYVLTGSGLVVPVKATQPAQQGSVVLTVWLAVTACALFVVAMALLALRKRRARSAAG